MIRLSEIVLPEWELIRDGEFAGLGLCTARPGLPLLTFCGNDKYLGQALANPDVSCVMIPKAMEIPACEKGIIAVPNLRVDFFNLHNSLAADPRYVGETFPTRIGNGCSISPLASIDPESVSIGNNVVIEPFVRIHAGSVIGDNCIIRSGTVLGGTGLEFIRNGSDPILGVVHLGKLIIGDDVEIQYNCNASRSLFPWHETRIGSGTKIESLVHIAHGVHIGERCLIAASACIAGSAILGNDVWIGPNATVSSEVKVGDNARVTLGAAAASNVRKGEQVTGNFALPHDLFMQDYLEKFRQ